MKGGDIMRYNIDNICVDVKLPWVEPHTMSVTNDGYVIDSRGMHNADYLSTNGRMYTFVKMDRGRMVLKPFDVILAASFIPIPKELMGKCVMVRHKNDVLMDNYIDNLEWVEDVEVWADVEYKDIKPGCYQVSNHGRVKSILKGEWNILKTTDECYSRLRLTTIIPGVRRYVSIHRLVANAFVPGWSVENDVVNHIDGDRYNNHYTNLEWVTNIGNLQHASMVGLIPKGDDSVSSKISESDAERICHALNKYNGSTDEVYSELHDKIHNLTRSIVSSIKYGHTFKHISRGILTKSGKTKIERHDDPEIILDVSRCLKYNNGDVKRTKKELCNKYPWITYGWLWHLKDKSVSSEITDMVFSRNEFPKTIPLSEADAVMIIETLLQYKGDKFATDKTYNDLKNEIDGLTRDKVRSIKSKKSWVELSNRYFGKDEI